MLFRRGRLGDRLDLDPGVEHQALPADDIVAAACDAGVDLDTPTTASAASGDRRRRPGAG